MPPHNPPKEGTLAETSRRASHMGPEEPIPSGRQSKIKKVSVQHTLERVRNNQRRHRARRRAHVEALESRLAQAEQTISELRAQLSSVKAEHEKCRPQFRRIESCHDAFLLPLPAGGGDVVQWRAQVPRTTIAQASTVAMASYELASSFSFDEELPYDWNLAAMPALLNDTAGHGVPVVPLIQSPAAVPRIPPGFHGVPTLTPSTSSPQSASWTGSDDAPAAPCCQGRQGPCDQPLRGGLLQPWAETYFDARAYDEPTILCSEASVLIAERNIKGVSQQTITMWLWSGFRRSLHPGGGCRVRTESLFALLAFISSG